MKIDNPAKQRRKILEKACKSTKSGGCGEATGHQQLRGPQDVLHVPAHVGHCVHILLVQLVDGGRQVLPDLFPAQGALGEVFRQILAQLILVPPVVQQALRIVLIMGIGEGVRQIVGQLPQRIILPDVPAGALLEELDMGVDIGLGIGEVVPAELVCPAGAFQLRQGIAVRLEGAEEKGQFITLGAEPVLTAQELGGQQLVTALLQGSTSRGFG